MRWRDVKKMKTKRSEGGGTREERGRGRSHISGHLCGEGWVLRGQRHRGSLLGH